MWLKQNANAIPKSDIAKGNDSREYITACPRNCYSTCSFRVVVADNKIRSIVPLPLNRATPHGVCLKGLSYLERSVSENRILYPHKKLSNGAFQRISWDEALDTIAEKLAYFRDRYGQQSVLFYSASGMSGLLNDFSLKFWSEVYGGATTVYGNLCWPAGLEATRLTLGANKHNVPWDLANARLIVLWGKNPAESNVQEMLPIGEALDNGGKLVVVDPRRTDSSMRAQLLIQPKPSTDAALALAVARLIVKNGWFDENFVSSYVEGFKRFVEHIQSCTPQWAADITGVPVGQIHELAKLIGKVKPMTLIPGYGMQRYTNGGQTVRAILALSVITGNIGKPGACWHYANLQSYVFDTLKEPLCYYPDSSTANGIRRSVSTARLGADMLSTSNPDLHMVWVERGNPITQNPNTNTVLKAFRKLDFRVVVEQFFTDTAREADIVLPAKNMFEQSDIIGSYWNPYIQLKQKVLEPAGEVWPETEIYWNLALRMGYSKRIVSEHLLPPGDEAVDRFLEDRLKSLGISIDDLKKQPLIAPGLQEIVFSDFAFDTPSGKIELYSRKAEELWGVNPLPSYEKAEELADTDSEYPLVLLTPNTKNRIHSQFGNLKAIQRIDSDPKLYINPKDAEKRRIRTGSTVRVFNGRGEIVVEADVTYEVRVGCVVVTNGWWNTDSGALNSLSEGRETDMGYGSAFHNNRVEVAMIMKDR